MSWTRRRTIIPTVENMRLQKAQKFAPFQCIRKKNISSKPRKPKTMINILKYWMTNGDDPQPREPLSGYSSPRAPRFLLSTAPNEWPPFLPAYPFEMNKPSFFPRSLCNFFEFCKIDMANRTGLRSDPSSSTRHSKNRPSAAGCSVVARFAATFLAGLVDVFPGRYLCFDDYMPKSYFVTQPTAVYRAPVRNNGKDIPVGLCVHSSSISVSLAHDSRVLFCTRLWWLLLLVRLEQWIPTFLKLEDVWIFEDLLMCFLGVNYFKKKKNFSDIR